MPIGPILRAELLRTARRGRYYVLRSVYGAILLFVVWTGYRQVFASGRRASIGEVATFALDTFRLLAVAQLLTVLVLVPPLFAGTIADEKQRKTLHYLMASRLSASEIVADKTLGRLPHLVVFLAIGLPVMSLIGLFGGVPWEFVVIAYVGTASSCAFAVALAVLVSTLARRVRSAVLASYGLIFSWLFLPWFIALVGSRAYVVVYQWIQPVNEWLQLLSPFAVGIQVALRGARGGRISPALDDFLWMVGLQLAGAVLLFICAVWQLRPAFRRHEAVPARRAWFSKASVRRRPRFLTRPECGNDPVLWKERYFAPADIFTKLMLLPVIVVITLPLALITEVEGNFVQLASEFWRSGLGARYMNRGHLASALRLDLGWYTGLWLLAVAGASASSIAIEREEDTWVSLTSTPLSGWQIVRGKVFGSIWNQRGFAAVLAFIWLLALVTGALQPIAVLMSIGLVGLTTWLAAMLGIHYSLRATSTSRALASTILALCLLNGFPIVQILWYTGVMPWDFSSALLGLMPKLAAAAPVSAESVARHWRLSPALPFGRYVGPLEIVRAGAVVLVAFYTVFAAVLTWRVTGHFDTVLDRPGLAASSVPPASAAAAAP
jgi:ABC-type transport system involved in multi-copper enzyme maturation permease subunit